MVRLSSQTFILCLSLLYSLGATSSLRPRDDTCTKKGFRQCGNPNVPKNFCCPETADCQVIDNARTVVCCPKGADCKTIRPITCDVRLQNVAIDPGSAIKTTRLTEELPKCGNMCCPHGFSCQGQSCILDNPSSEPILSSSTSIAPTTMTSATPTSSTSTPSATGAPAAPPKAEQKCNDFPPGAIAAGFFPGFVAGIIASVAVLSFRRSPRPASQPHQNHAGHSQQRTLDGNSISISDPIPSATQDSFRTDFLRQQSSCYGQNGNDNRRSRIQRTSDRVRSLFAPKFTVLTDQQSSTVPPVPTTPPGSAYPKRTTSTESIKVYSPGNLGGGDRLRPPPGLTINNRPPTTFTEMMERAGFQNGRGSPCYPVSDTLGPPSKASAGSPLRRI